MITIWLIKFGQNLILTEIQFARVHNQETGGLAFEA